MSLTNHDVFNYAPELPWQEIDGNILVLQPSKQAAHELNSVGSFIWKTIDGRKSVSDVAQAMFDEFEIDFDTALKEARDFLTLLKEKQLIV